MQRWAKLHAKTSESGDFAQAVNDDPRLGLLFLLILPHLTPYGVILAHARTIAGRVCGLIDWSDDEVAAMVDSLSQSALIHTYTDSNGRAMAYAPGYHRNQDIKWSRVGTSEYDLPHCWEPPPELVEAISKDKSIKAAGWKERVLPDQSRSGPGVAKERIVQDQSRSGPGVVLDNEQSPENAGPGVVRDQSCLEVDVEVDVEVETDTPTPNDVGGVYETLGRLFTCRPNGLPDDWGKVISGWQRQYGSAEVDYAADATAAKFSKGGTINRAKVRTYMLGVLRRRADERITSPAPSGNGEGTRWQGWPAGESQVTLRLPCTPELVEGLASSPDYKHFRTEIHKHFSGDVLYAVKQRRLEIEAGGAV